MGAWRRIGRPGRIESWLPDSQIGLEPLDRFPCRVLGVGQFDASVILKPLLHFTIRRYDRAVTATTEVVSDFRERRTGVLAGQVHCQHSRRADSFLPT